MYYEKFKEDKIHPREPLRRMLFMQPAQRSGEERCIIAHNFDWLSIFVRKGLTITDHVVCKAQLAPS